MNYKELVLLKKTYRQITEEYYENTSDMNAEIIINLNDLLVEIISTKNDADKLCILSTL